MSSSLSSSVVFLSTEAPTMSAVSSSRATASSIATASAIATITVTSGAATFSSASRSTRTSTSSTASPSLGPPATNRNCQPDVIQGGWFHTQGFNGIACGVSFPPSVLNIRSCCANGTSTTFSENGGADVRVDNDCVQYCVIPSSTTTSADDEADGSNNTGASTFHTCVRNLIRDQVAENGTSFISLCNAYGDAANNSEASGGSGGGTSGASVAVPGTRAVSAVALWTIALLGWSVLWL